MFSSENGQDKKQGVEDPLTRVYYRLSLSALCALAAVAAPVYFLEDRFRVGYLIGGLAAALLGWAYLSFVMLAEAHLRLEVQGVLGAAAALLSWSTISLVALFDVIPHAMHYGLARFDPIWLLGGLSPLVVLLVAWWFVSNREKPLLEALFVSLCRFSVPLCGLVLTARLLGLPKQYRWLFLFTGVMFLVLDGLGTGHDLPLVRSASAERQ